MSMSSSANSLAYSFDNGNYSTHDILVLLGIGFSAASLSILLIVLCECLCCRRRHHGNTILYVAGRPFFQNGRAGGLSPAAVATLPSFKYNRSISNGCDSDRDRDRAGGSGSGSGSGSGRGWAQCAVCLSLVQEGEMVRQLPACEHLFHVGCVDMWLYSHSTCPLCRAAVEAVKEAPTKEAIQIPPV